MSEQNKEAALTYLKALGRGDAVLMDSILTDDFDTLARGTAKICGRRTREETVAFTGAVPSLFKDGIRFEFESITAEADRVACQLKGYSTLADGRVYNNEYIYLFHVRDGKIYHMDEYIDTKYADETLLEMMDELQVK
ncbi:nuclear transport factor 2 family protein [Parafrankia sp. EUN1f]|uniref:nuclear transport factor 2 family protein n=1 Tax=Parafrankia sp. EUN1f TaxID=102897 RepID=UPI0001C47793|nr:nuclear transport factor 2 family protein [Parafrankia sp. EUN1f]EFC86814.1 hypothetical protein FrEUN1fDRAFT_0065 [Parafrankia sp. EUN1f]